MNKQQLNYLTNKINSEADAAIDKFKQDNPTQLTEVEKYDKLKTALDRAGITLLLNRPEESAIHRRGYYHSPFNGYLEYPSTKAMASNQAKVKAFTDKVNEARRKAIDAANLGDNKDALAILEAFITELRKVK